MKSYINSNPNNQGLRCGNPDKNQYAFILQIVVRYLCCSSVYAMRTLAVITLADTTKPRHRHNVGSIL